MFCFVFFPHGQLGEGFFVVCFFFFFSIFDIKGGVTGRWVKFCFVFPFFMDIEEVVLFVCLFFSGSLNRIFSPKTSNAALKLSGASHQIPGQLEITSLFFQHCISRIKWYFSIDFQVYCTCTEVIDLKNKCHAIKHNESELAKSRFEIQPSERRNFLCFLLFYKTFNCLYLWDD